MCMGWELTFSYSGDSGLLDNCTLHRLVTSSGFMWAESDKYFCPLLGIGVFSNSDRLPKNTGLQ